MKNILSLCGGGTSGFMSASFIGLIEDEFDINFIDHFDLVAGVSTGSILGGALLSGYTGKEIKEFYKESFTGIFAKKRWIRALYKSFYNNDDLYRKIEEYLGDMKMSHMKKPFMCHALKLSVPSLEVKFWKSWKEEDANVSVCDVLTASSSSPIAFEPTKIDGQYYYDGGLILNDPSLSSYIEGKKLFPNEELRVLNIQTDYHPGYLKPKKIRGLLGVTKEFSKLTIDGAESATTYMATQLIDNYINCNPKIYLAIDSDDWDYMDSVASVMFETNKHKIKEIFT